MSRFFAALCLIVCLGSLATGQDGKGRLAGLAYADYFYNISRDPASGSFSNTAVPGPKAFQAFQFRRVYFTYDYDMTEEFTSRFRLEADQTALTSDGKIGVFVKDAFLRWKNIVGSSELIVGIQPSPAFEVSEGIWGFRALEKTIMDLRGIVSSRDLGVSFKGKAGENGMVGYWFMIANGTGNKPESDKYKRYYGHVQLKPAGSLVVTAYADYNARPSIVNPFSVTQATVSNSALTTAVFASIKPSENVRVGVEGFLQSTFHGMNTGTALASKNGMGISIFGVAGLDADLDAVVRFDYFDPNTNTLAKGDGRNYILAGLAWKVNKNVSVIPNLQIETFEKSPAGTTFDSSVTGRITMYWLFP